MNLNSQRKKVIFLLNEITQNSCKKKCEEYEKLIYEHCKSKPKYYETLSYEKLGEIQYIMNNKKDINKMWNKLFDDIKHARESSIYEELKMQKMNMIRQNLFDETKLQKCEFPCRNKKCKSDQCYFYSEQTRSGDEGMTSTICCLRCGGRWKFN